MVPPKQVVLFAAKDGSCPLLGCVDEFPPRAQQKLLAQIHLLHRFGDGKDLANADSEIRLLQILCNGNTYHLSYFLQDSCAVLLHAWICGSDPESEQLSLAVDRRRQFEMNPDVHTYFE